MTPEQLASKIDHTILGPHITAEDFIQKTDEMKKYKFRSLCIPSNKIIQARKLLPYSLICSVVNFPHGNSHALAVRDEALMCCELGADELDVVVPINYTLDKDLVSLCTFISELDRISDEEKVRVKYIIESGALSKEQISFVFHALAISTKIKDDDLVPYIKTSTGFNGEGAKEEDVKYIRSLLSGKYHSKFLIKASGGIRSLKDATKMLDAGAHALGCSGSVKIIEELEQQ